VHDARIKALLWFSLLLIGSLLIGTLLAFRIPTTTITFGRQAYFWLGILLINAGIVLRLYAIKMLGSYFTTRVAVAPGQTVITYGPYRYIRHPSYSGLLMILLGYGFCLTNWVSVLIIMGCALVGLGYRIRVEERVLQEQLGQPYKDYMRHTKRLIPFVV
jgi:protein-S-isoprenylcysteine O-methyltransferase Ste14